MSSTKKPTNDTKQVANAVNGSQSARKKDDGDTKADAKTPANQDQESQGANHVLTRSSQTIQGLVRQICGCENPKVAHREPLTDEQAATEITLLTRQIAWEREFELHSAAYRVAYLGAANAMAKKLPDAPSDLGMWAEQNHARLCCRFRHSNTKLIFD
jgi:hypothetical protein